MRKEHATTPAQTLALLNTWQEAAQTVVYHIGCTRGPHVACHREDKSPWPVEAIDVLLADTPRVIDYLSTEHALNVQVPLDRIAKSARTWKAKRSRVVRFSRVRHADEAAAVAAMRELAEFTEDGLPERRRLDLDLRIAEGALWRAGFPLLARLPNRHSFLIRGKLIAWANWVMRAFGDVIRDWELPHVRSGWSESQERWELANVIFPRSVPDTNKGPKKLAIEEARSAGDLAVALPPINSFFDVLQAFVIEAVNHPQGNVQPACTEYLLRAAVTLEELVGTCGSIAGQPSEGGASAKTDKPQNGGATGDSIEGPPMKPSHKQAKLLHEWAMEHIEGAESMTYAQVFAALVEQPACGGEGLPANAATFARYCRAAGSRRNSPRRAKSPTRSVRRQSDI